MSVIVIGFLLQQYRLKCLAAKSALCVQKEYQNQHLIITLSPATQLLCRCLLRSIEIYLAQTRLVCAPPPDLGGFILVRPPLLIISAIDFYQI